MLPELRSYPAGFAGAILRATAEMAVELPAWNLPVPLGEFRL